MLWTRFNGNLSDRVSVSGSISAPTGYGNVTRVNVNLTIINASREDTGIYTCSASNSMDSDSRNTSITIQCKFLLLRSTFSFIAVSVHICMCVYTFIPKRIHIKASVAMHAYV